MRCGAVVVVAGLLALSESSLAAAQTADPGTTPVPALTDGVVPAASFGASFRKYAPPDNDFSAFASWDADLNFNVSAMRRGPHGLDIGALVQSIGLEVPGSRVGVAAIGYIIRISYVHNGPDDTVVSAGLMHLSSHLTRDLEQQIDGALAQRTRVPRVEDPAEYNVPYVRVVRTWAARRLRPRLEVAVQPINVRVGTWTLDEVRPLYVAFAASLWRTPRVTVAVETQHEIGTRPLNNFTAVFDVHGPARDDGRLQFFTNVSFGDSFHVSPNLGGLRDGVGIGVRLKFRAN